MTTTNKTHVIQALSAFMRQRPGLEFANYGDVSAYRSELRSITKDLGHARELLNYVEDDADITAAAIIEAAKHAYSGRLTIEDRGDGNIATDYCTGQYFPTEYRKAVCAVLASAIWDQWREEIPADFEGSKGDELRKRAMRRFGRGIAGVWFR